MNSEYCELLRQRLKKVREAISTLSENTGADSYTIFGAVQVTKSNSQQTLITLKDEEAQLLHRLLLASGINRKLYPYYK